MRTLQGRVRLLLASAFGLAALAPASGGECSGAICFADRSAEMSLGDGQGAIAVLDYDGDGYPDLFLGGAAGQQHRLLHNEADPGLPQRRLFVDASAGSGLDDADGTARNAGGAVAADYDNDGDSDLFVTAYRSSNATHGLLYRNDGDGRFTNVSLTSGVRQFGIVAESASWTDYDLDGFVDLMICGWGTGTAGNFRLLHNERDGTFSEASHLLPELGLVRTVWSHLWMDYDQDGWADGFIPSDNGPAVVLKNVSDGRGGRRFIDVADDLGFRGFEPWFPMGIAAGDFDGDGDLDLGISTIAQGAYFENRGDVLREIFPFQAVWGWGVDWIDVDNDGDLDFYMAASYQPGSGGGANEDVLFRNRGAGGFDDVSPALGGAVVASKHSVQLDYDNDGRRDLIVCNPGLPGESVSVYENRSGAGNHWITLRMRGSGVSNRDAIGAIVRLDAGGRTQVREVISGSSTSASEDLRLHFGLGDTSSVSRIQVVWPRKGPLRTRTSLHFGPFAADRVVTLCEPVLNPRGLGADEPCLDSPSLGVRPPRHRRNRR